ncbi:MAG: methionine synthase [Thermaerobacter sp.]|nr:methionine synthase [Bacillota bacterium]REJ36527.1 MAG: methionine synthase [Bacillota bacterium]
MRRKQRILGAAVGDCVHVAGVVNFLRLAEEQGYETEFLGPAVPVPELIGAVLEDMPDMVAVGYRLTPEAARHVLEDLKRAAAEAGLVGRVRFVFGGTAPVAEVARRVGLFERVFDGASGAEAVIAFLRGGGARRGAGAYPDTLLDRIRWKAPYPVIRHHFGLPDYEATRRGIAEIAESGCLDVISLGIDQNTQEHFFRPHLRDPGQHGAGGVPVETREQFAALYEASRRGNYPLMRCYSGTRDLLAMAEMLHETIRNAWCAVPLTWYSVLDGRSDRSLPDTIREAQQVMAWHARRGVPVEMNESHHWSLRDAPDTVACAAAFLAAYNARQAGVRHYIQQLMFNNPPGTSFAMDLAKMLAKLELVESLQGEDFQVLRETRSGLSSYPADLDMARGHLASSIVLQMAVKPHIVHVVGYPEADHAATAREVIESCLMARRAIENCLTGMPDMTLDPRVQARKAQLVEETRLLLDAIRGLAPAGTGDPWTDPVTLTRAVEAGLLDAPHLRGNPTARGRVVTRIVDGACVAVDPETREPLPERERIARALADYEASVA